MWIEQKVFTGIGLEVRETGFREEMVIRDPRVLAAKKSPFKL